MNRHWAYYRTRDGKADYKFSFEEQVDGSWRAYIESQPSYNGRDTGLHPTHRLIDGDRYYICWDSPLKSLKQVKYVAALWADATQEYIRTGKEF